jgi:hypothetical protein
MAVREWDPTPRVEVARVAVPPESVAVPRRVAPSKKSTVPVGVPPPGATAVTVAVRVFACPKTDGSGADVRAVELAAWVTVWVSTGEVEPVKLALPLYTAVREWDPTPNALVVNVAVPPESVAVPRRVAPSKKSTVPVGVPPPGATAVTVAVRVFACPKTDGSGADVRAVELAAWVTVWVSTGEVEPVKLALPLYTAVREWDPTPRVEVARVAVPPESAAVPSRVAPSKKSTVPVGVPPPGATAVTVAVRVLASPNTDGSGAEVRAVDVAAWVTVWVSTGEVEPVKSVSPLYTAVRECDPTPRVEVARVAVPPESAAVPTRVAPSKKSTVPVGVPAPGATAATVAVRVLLWPKTDGSGAEVSAVDVAA